MKLQSLFSWNEFPEKHIVDPDLEVTGLAFDSRKVGPGFVFFALHGSNTDGHLYIPKAIQNGAIGVVFSDVAMPLDVNTVSWIRVDDVRRTLARVADRYFQHPSAQLRITGVTGTNGKTTTCFFLRNIWEENGYPCGLLTTVKNIIGPDESEAKNTTEESLSLQMDLAAMRDKGIRHAVLEVSSHGLALGRVEGILFDTAVVTNVVAEHLEFHKTFENYFTSKKKLLSMLEENLRKGFPRVVAVNGDDPNCRAMIRDCGVPTLTYGMEDGRDVRADKIVFTLDGTHFTVRSPWGSFPVTIAFSGQYSVYNALASITPSLYSGIPADTIVQALARTRRVPGRWEVIKNGQDFSVIVDFAHNWHGLENTLSHLRKVTRGRVITVFGCGGERDRKKRPLMGETVGCWSDVCIVTSDNPRGEEPAQTASDAMEGVQRAAEARPLEVQVILDRRTAIQTAFEIARAGDVVFLAGKGPERYQAYRDKMIPHNDYDIAVELLKEMYP